MCLTMFPPSVKLSRWLFLATHPFTKTFTFYKVVWWKDGGYHAPCVGSSITTNTVQEDGWGKPFAKKGQLEWGALHLLVTRGAAWKLVRLLWGNNTVRTVKVERKDIVAAGLFKKFGRSVAVRRYTFDPPLFEETHESQRPSREDQDL